MQRPDLPPELRPFWDSSANPIPANARSTISLGWGKMNDAEKADLLRKLAAESDNVERIVIASRAALEAAMRG